MKLLKNISVNLKMVFTNYGFYLCMVFTVILCMCASIYYDGMKNEMYSIIKSLKEFDREFMLNDTSFCSYQVIDRGSGSWLSMFVPIISAFAFVPMVCDEAESKMIRNSVFRSSKLTFHTSKFVTACLSGGLAVMLGFAVFAIIVSFTFPNIDQYSSELQEHMNMNLSYSFPKLAQHGYGAVISVKFLEMFIYGTVSAAPAIMLTSFIKNKYLVMCIPFFFKYAITQTCVKLNSKAWSNFENPNERLGKIVNIIAPDSVVSLFQYTEKNYILIYNLLLITVAFIVYIIIQKRRLDCGE